MDDREPPVKRDLLTLSVMMGLLFMIGFVCMFTGPLAAVVKNQFGASNALSQFGTSATFLAFLFAGVPTGLLLKRRGYRLTALSAVSVGLAGVSLQIVASFAASFAVYVAGTFVSGLSLCMMGAGAAVSAYCALMMVGRFAGGLVGNRVSPRMMLGVASAVSIALLVAAALVPFVKVPIPFASVSLPLGAVLMVACGSCISIMFGGIFNLATEGLGRLVPVASGVTMFLVSGGALLAVVGLVTDRFGILSSCWVFAGLLAYVFFFAVRGSRLDDV